MFRRVCAAAPIEDENSVPQSALQGETLRWLES
jgi:hypothetical protein